MKEISVKLNVIGVVHSPYKSPSEVPLKRKDYISEIEMESELLKGLTDIEGFTHLHVFYWLHKSNLMVFLPPDHPIDQTLLDILWWNLLREEAIFYGLEDWMQ